VLGFRILTHKPTSDDSTSVTRIENTLRADLPLQFSPLHRLQWEEAQQKHVILYPEGMVELNPSAAEILLLCDGVRTLDNIVAVLEEKFAVSALTSDVTEFLEIALANRWIEQA
jgi:pyrroloquinoline quinone biosynthesis protein D